MANENGITLRLGTIITILTLICVISAFGFQQIWVKADKHGMEMVEKRLCDRVDKVEQRFYKNVDRIAEDMREIRTMLRDMKQ